MTETVTSAPSNVSLVNFKWEVSVGQLIQLIVVIGAGVLLYTDMDKRISRLEDELPKMVQSINEIKSTVADMGKASAAAVERFQIQANSRMDVFSGNINQIQVSVSEMKANMDSFIRYEYSGKTRQDTHLRK